MRSALRSATLALRPKNSGKSHFLEKGESACVLYARTTLIDTTLALFSPKEETSQIELFTP